MRQFAVIGLGNFGANMAIKLCDLGHPVLAIDNSEAAMETVRDQVTQPVVADALDRRVLESLGVGDVDCAIVSLGSRVDASILLTLYLKELGIKEIVVKAVSEDHKRILGMIGATTVILPEKDTAIRTAYALANPNIVDRVPLAPGFSILEMTTPPDFVGKSLLELEIRSKYNIEIVAIKNSSNVPEEQSKIVVIPSSSHRLKKDDVLVVIASDKNMEQFHKDHKASE